MSAKQATNFAPIATLAECAEAYALVQYHRVLEKDDPQHYGLDFYVLSRFSPEYILSINKYDHEPSPEKLVRHLASEDYNCLTFQAMFHLASPIARMLFAEELFERVSSYHAAKEKAEIELDSADTEIQIQRVSDQTIASLHGIENALYKPVLSALGTWAALSRTGDQKSNAAWIELSRMIVRAKDAHDSQLRSAKLAAAVIASVGTTPKKVRAARSSAIRRKQLALDRNVVLTISQGHSADDACEQARTEMFEFLCTLDVQQ